MYRAVVIAALILEAQGLHAAECPPGIAFKSFHTYWPARAVDRTIFSRTGAVFQRSEFSPDQLRAMFQRYRFQSFGGVQEFINAYQKLRVAEDVGVDPWVKKAVFDTGFYTDAQRLFHGVEPEKFTVVSPSQELLRQFVLPILLEGVDKYINIPQNRSWLVWDVGAGTGGASYTLHRMLPAESQFVLTDSSERIEKYWAKKLAQSPDSPFAFVGHDAVRERFGGKKFHATVGGQSIQNPDLVVVLNSIQQWSGHADFDIFLDNLIPGLRPHTLVIMEIHHRHESYFGRNYATFVEGSSYYRMMVAKGFIPIREVNIPGLGYSVFLFAYHLDIAAVYSEWVFQQMTGINKKIRYAQ